MSAAPDTIGVWLREIGSYELLKPEEERRLLERVGAGDSRAKEKLIKHNLRLVVFVAKKYARNAGTLEFLDLIQEGSVGLKRAIEKFDLRYGKLSTYAVQWIRQAITRAIADSSRTVRVPVHVYDAVRDIKKAQFALRQKLGRAPSLEEIAAEVEETCDWVIGRLEAFRQIGSLDAPIAKRSHRSDPDTTTLGELIAANESGEELWEAAEASEQRQQLEILLSRLKPKHALVMRLRYGLDGGAGMTLEQVGAQLNLTRERIRQIEAKALRELRAKAVTTDIRVSKSLSNTGGAMAMSAQTARKLERFKHLCDQMVEQGVKRSKAELSREVAGTGHWVHDAPGAGDYYENAIVRLEAVEADAHRDSGRVEPAAASQQDATDAEALKQDIEILQLRCQIEDLQKQLQQTAQHTAEIEAVLAEKEQAVAIATELEQRNRELRSQLSELQEAQAKQPPRLVEVAVPLQYFQSQVQQWQETVAELKKDLASAEANLAAYQHLMKLHEGESAIDLPQMNHHLMNGNGHVANGSR